MTVVALTNFLEITDARGVVQFRFQNSRPGNPIKYRGHDYAFLSFLYEGASKNRTGDNLESALILASNSISMGYATESVRSRWNVRMDSCSMHPETFEVGRTLTTEHWLAASMSYDMEAVEVTLSSSIDAVGASAPTRSLTKTLVGSIPTTGSVTNR